MGTDLVVRFGAEVAEAAADPAEFVALACERAKDWLVAAVERGDIEAIVETKAQAEAIRIYTAQKNLGKDAELAAQEVVRRAERGLGVAIRRGQEEGTVAKPGDIGGPGGAPGVFGGVPGSPRNGDLGRPSEFFENHSERTDAYAMTDSVSDEQFEAAVEEAKAEGNLSRANVVRKVRGEVVPKSEWHYKRRHIDVNRVVEVTITTLESAMHGLNLVDINDATEEKRAEWRGRYRAAIRELNKFFREV